MPDIIKVFIAFVLIVLLLRWKINLGGAMAIGAISLALFYQLPVSESTGVFLRTVTAYTTIQLIVALGLIMVMENIMRKTETFSHMMDALRKVVNDTRVVLAAPPAIIGMVPSIGGAYFSAPLVEEASSALSITPERKGFINYWFRHIWEYVLPTYPGILLASAVTGIPLNRLILYQAPFAVMVILSGAIFCFKGIKRKMGDENETLMPLQGTKHENVIPAKAGIQNGSNRLDSCFRRNDNGLGGFSGENKNLTEVKSGEDLRSLILSLLPIGTIIILVALFHIDIALTMLLVTSGLFIYHRYSLKRIMSTLRESISWKILLIIIGVILFKEMLDATGAVDGISHFLTRTGFPLIVLFFVLPFLVGFLTGLTIAFVGATFPLLISMTGGSPATGEIAFAFASGFTGVMFSPVHLCFVLTGEYFRADRGAVYRYILIPSGMVMLTALVMWWVK